MRRQGGIRGAAPDLARLPLAFDIRAISLVEGLRAALSTAAIISISAVFHWPVLVEAALAALFTCLCDIGGPIRRRVPALVWFAVLGACIIVLGGLARGLGLWAALPFAVVVILCGGLARVYGPQAQQVGMFLSVVLVFSLDHAAPDFEEAAVRGGAFLAGGLWASLLTLVLWRVRPFQPVRRALADCFEALAGLTRDLQGLLGQADIDVAAWESHARSQRRLVRTAIEVARTRIMDTLRARGPMSLRATQSLLRVETADQLFGALIALSELLELAGAADRAVALHMLRRLRPLLVVLGHEMLADRTDAHEQIARSIAAIGRDMAGLPAESRLRGLGELIVARLRVVLTVAATADGRIDAGPGKDRPLLARLLTPLGANLSWGSAALRHAVRTTVTAAPALVFSLVHDGPFDHWLTITIVVTMQPFFGNTLMRALERVAGTTMGGLLAAGLGLVITTPLANALAMFPLALLAFALRSVSFGLFISALTPMIVLLVELGQPGTSDAVIALTRMGLTLGGGLLAVAGCTLLWPDWEPNRLEGELRVAIAAHGRYAEREIALLLGEATTAEVEQARRAAGLASNNVEASVARALLEPRGAAEAGLERAMVIDAALRRMAGRLTAMQYDPGQTAALPVAAWREWQGWITAAMAALAKGEKPGAHPTGDTEALGRIARQVELMAGAGRK